MVRSAATTVSRYLASLPAERRRVMAAVRKAGRKLDMGKSCVRFRGLEDLPLDAIGEIVASTSVKQFIARYEASRRR
jgi:hypothetical protein